MCKNATLYEFVVQVLIHNTAAILVCREESFLAYTDKFVGIVSIYMQQNPWLILRIAIWYFMWHCSWLSFLEKSTDGMMI